MAEKEQEERWEGRVSYHRKSKCKARNIFYLFQIQICRAGRASYNKGLGRSKKSLENLTIVISGQV